MTENTIDNDITSEEVVKTFLEHYLKTKSKLTAKSYGKGVKVFVSWFRKRENKPSLTAREILEMRKDDLTSSDFQKARRFSDIFEEFHKDLTNEDGEYKLGINTATTYGKCAKAFFNYYNLSVKVSFRNVITGSTFIPEISQLKRMFAVADLRDKVVLSLGLDLAWRIGDFLELRKKDIPDLNGECPIQIERLTHKEKELSSTFISCETVQLLKEYMNTLRPENEFLFQASNGSHIDQETINDTLKSLARKINLAIPEGKHLSWHSLRKRFLSTAINLGIDDETRCLLVGKAIDSSHATYYGDLKLKGAFIIIRNALSLQLLIEDKDKEIEKLQKALSSVEEENSQLKTRVENLQKKFGTQEKTVSELAENFEYFVKHGKKKPIIETSRA